MSQSPQFREKFQSPELFLSELLKKSSQGNFYERDESLSFLYRATVVAVDTVGGQLENVDGQGSITHLIDGKKNTTSAVVGPKNPRNSIKARIITDGFDQFIRDDRLRVFWPFFPEHMSPPVKPNEHVYVIFEDKNFEHGLWVTKIPGQENVNFFRGQDAFLGKEDKNLSSNFDDSRGLSGKDQENLSTDVAAGESLVKEGNLSELF